MLNDSTKLTQNAGSNNASDSKTDRRDFIKMTSAAALTSLTGVSLLGQSALAATPKSGGKFTLALSTGGSSDTLDPATFTSSQQIHIGYAIRNNLTEIGADNELKPELAESWAVSADAKKWVFKIRKGIEFHNGKALRASDVVATLNYHRAEDSKSAAKSLLSGVSTVTATDEHTVEVSLSSGSADFPFVLTDYHLGIMPANGNGEVDASGIGTGPYVIKEFNAGVSSRFTRFANYWKDGHAHFDEVELLIIADVVARQNALVSGEVDAIDEVDLKTIKFLGRDKNLVIEERASGFHANMPMFHDTAPFDNNHVRMALKHSIDREAILKLVLRGHGTLGNDHPISPSMPFYDDSIPQRAYDPEKAKWHLKQAGMSELDVSLSATDGVWAGATDTAILFKEHASKAGININVVREPADDFWSSVWQKKPFIVSFWGARPTPDVMYSLAYAKEAAWNDMRFSHDKFNKLLVEARAELDQSKRAELYSVMQRIIHDEGSTVVPFFKNHVFAHRKNIMNSGTMSGNWQMDGHKAMERWWKA